MKKITLTEEWYDEDVGEFSDKISCYLLDELPKYKEYFDYGKDKGYVVFIMGDDMDNIVEKEYLLHTIYYEDKLGEFERNDKLFLNYCFVATKKES